MTVIESVQPSAVTAASDGPRVVCDRRQLAAAVSAVRGVMGKEYKPWMACVHLSADGDAVRVEATDLERRAWQPVTAQVERTGACLIPADRLADCLRAATADAISLDVAGGNGATVGTLWTGPEKQPDARWRLFGLDPAQWPPAAEGDDPEPLGTVPAADFARLVEQSAPFARAAMNYPTSGVLLATEGKKPKELRAVATDGRRLAVAGCPWPGNPLPGNLIVPADALRLAAKWAGADPDGEVSIWADDRACVIRTPGGTLRTVLVEGTFVPWADVVPKGCDKALEADRDALLAVVEQAAALLPNETKDVNGKPVTSNGIRLALGKRGVRLSGRSPLAGDGEAELACKFTGADLEIGFNSAFLAAALSACRGPGVRVEFAAANRPCLITDGGSDFRNVLMPVGLS